MLSRLTKYNWTTEYKNAAKCLALNYGEAGEIGKDLMLPKPDRHNHVEYPENERGDRIFEKAKERYSKLKDHKKSTLLLLTDFEV
jgi:hypothetical protein